jgi:hypothetical protein
MSASIGVRDSRHPAIQASATGEHEANATDIEFDDKKRSLAD